MPIKWTAEVDRILFLTIISTHGIKIDADKVIKAWPKSSSEKPTARAISERIRKLRKDAGIGAGVGASVSTPKTPRSTIPKKRVAEESEAEESEAESDTVPKVMSGRSKKIARTLLSDLQQIQQSVSFPSAAAAVETPRVESPLQPRASSTRKASRKASEGFSAYMDDVGNISSEDSKESWYNAEEQV